MWVILNEAHVTMIVVDPLHRRRRFGERLLSALIDEAMRRSARWVTLEVRKSNLGAQNLYRKYGLKTSPFARATIATTAKTRSSCGPGTSGKRRSRNGTAGTAPASIRFRPDPALPWVTVCANLRSWSARGHHGPARHVGRGAEGIRHAQTRQDGHRRGDHRAPPRAARALQVPPKRSSGELPKTSTGKVQKFILQEREWQGREKRVN